VEGGLRYGRDNAAAVPAPAHGVGALRHAAHGKLAHGTFHAAALLRHNTEPNSIGLGSD